MTVTSALSLFFMALLPALAALVAMCIVKLKLLRQEEARHGEARRRRRRPKPDSMRQIQECVCEVESKES